MIFQSVLSDARFYHRGKSGEADLRACRRNGLSKDMPRPDNGMLPGRGMFYIACFI